MPTNEISVREGEAQIILHLSGAIDAPRVSDLLAAAVTAFDSRKQVVLDWSEADHLHSGALQVLMALYTELTSQSRPLQVTACSEPVRNCLVLAGLTQTFPPEVVLKEDSVANGTDR